MWHARAEGWDVKNDAAKRPKILRPVKISDDSNEPWADEVTPYEPTVRLFFNVWPFLKLINIPIF